MSQEEEVSQAFLPTATHSHLDQEKLSSACCIYCEQCNELKTRHSLTADYKAFNLYERIFNARQKIQSLSKNMSFKQKLGGQAQQLRESLQIYLIKTQVEETMMDDKQTSLLQHLSLISDVCEAVMQHMQYLQVSYLVVKRIFDMSHALLACPPSSADQNFILHYRQIEVEKEKRLSSLRELLECCSTNIALPKAMCALLDDYRDRKRDFFLASSNFKSLLENSRLSVSRMEKLQRQYDTILKDFQQSRRLLDAELPKIIDARLEALRQIFDNVAELYNNMDYNMHTANLFKLIAMNLRQVASDLSEKAIFHEQAANKEMCQKCKMDYADKK